MRKVIMKLSDKEERVMYEWEPDEMQVLTHAYCILRCSVDILSPKHEQIQRVWKALNALNEVTYNAFN